MEIKWFTSTKKDSTQESFSKVVVSDSWDKDGILLVDYFKKGARITADYFTSLLHKVKQTLVTKHQKHQRKLSKWVLFLHDKASSHMGAITQQKLSEFHF